MNASEFIDTLEDITPEAAAFIRDSVAAGVPVEWNPRLRVTAGRCIYSLGKASKIDLNPRLREEGPEATLNTFLHEAAHAIVGPKGHHGREWQRVHRLLGGNAKRCHSFETMIAERAERRVVGRCESCGVEFRRARRFPRNRTFTHSGNAKGFCGGTIRPV
jgi:predicted SprT family Zn-dependent metalloprotease